MFKTLAPVSRYSRRPGKFIIFHQFPAETEVLCIFDEDLCGVSPAPTFPYIPATT
jgi:hypothetical protein